jgi:AcrR family transcriptional regulator
MPSTPQRPSPARGASRRPRRPQPALAAKKQPAQQRATETYERILEVTAQTLADVGIERLSTNLVCERAGLTPPALYRYFPNKYALLNELGQRLMQRQNELIPRWITPEVLAGTQDGLERALQGLLLDTHRVTHETVAGVWITRALRAVPALERVRLASHEQVTQAQGELMAVAFPQADPQELRLVGRIAVEMIYAAVEMLFDDPPLDAQAVASIVAAMIASYLQRIRPEAGTAKPRRR